MLSRQARKQLRFGRIVDGDIGLISGAL